LTLGSVLSTARNRTDESVGDDFDWDPLTTVYEKGEYFEDYGSSNDVVRTRPLNEGSNENVNNGSDESDLENSSPPRSTPRDFFLGDENRSDHLHDKLDDRQTSDSGGRLAIRPGGITKIIESMNSLGYDDDQVSEFLTNLEMNFDEFEGLHLDEQIGEITKVLDGIGHTGGSDPTYSELSAEENEKVIRRQRLRKETGASSNLMSSEFANEKGLHSLTTLSSKISMPNQQRKSRSTDPGEEGDPYRSIMVDIDSQPPPPPPPGAGAEAIKTNNSEELAETRKEYLHEFDSRLNQFVGNTPFQTENSIAINNFLRRAMIEDPREVAASVERKEEERKLRESLRENFNPNNTCAKDVVSYDNLNVSGASNDPELKFEKKVIIDTEDIEISAENLSSIYGKPSIGKIVENALQDVKDNEESTVGGLLGNTHGTNSFTNFTPEDYYKLCGVSGEEDFQSLLNEKIESDDSRNINFFNDQTK